MSCESHEHSKGKQTLMRTVAFMRWLLFLFVWYKPPASSLVFFHLKHKWVSSVFECGSVKSVYLNNQTVVLLFYLHHGSSSEYWASFCPAARCEPFLNSININAFVFEVRNVPTPLSTLCRSWRLKTPEPNCVYSSDDLFMPSYADSACKHDKTKGFL